MELIRKSENRFPVSEWTMDGIRIWPLIRLEITSKNDIGWTKVAYPSSMARHAARTKKILSETRGLLAALTLDYRKKVNLPAEVDGVFLSDGVSFQLLRGRWYEKFCDPFITEFNKRGLRTMLLTPGYANHLKRHTPSIFLQPQLELARLRSLFSFRNPPAHLPGHREWEAFVAGLENDFLFPQMKAISRQVAIIKAWAETYKKIMLFSKPKIGMLVNYYNMSGMAFILACKELGIVSAEIQHGFQGEMNVAYGRFDNVPPDGYELLPNVFWVWGEREARTIRHWSGACGGAHRVLVGGNLFLKQWSESENALTREYASDIAKISSPGFKHVVYTLGSESAEEVKGIAAAIRISYAKGFRWWVRLHPGFLSRSDEIADSFKRQGIVGINLNAASKLPLYALLLHADAHLTKYSSTVIEAAALGVPSVLTESDSHIFFPEQTASGMATTALTAGEIVEALEKQCLKFPRGWALAPHETAGHPIETLLEIAQKDNRNLGGLDLDDRIL